MDQQPIVDQHSTPADKIALFRSLFRGREDVYPRRFESRKTVRSGYSPACANEWARDLCNKRQVQCAECPNRSFLPVTDEVVRCHLSGQDATGREFVLGVYPMLARMFDRRCQGYEAIGYSILLPASAVPGWPAEVPLPVEPEWKRDYAASVQRLIRDGVDAHLGNLFVHATRAFQRDAEGADRARSATEAFLYRRLETLPATQGKFRLNADLPIPFDGYGRMEVDLLFAEKRVAIELDGPQHLSDTDAYRRDRRKDALLQENGWFVLRFLAEDVGRHLDAVLDAILRAGV